MGNKVSVALQGGGSHGAFTWGVLDKILEDGRIEIEGASGTSAGGMNAVSLIYGLLCGNNDTARDAMTKFWDRACDLGALSPFKPAIFDKMQGNNTLENSPGYAISNLLGLYVSPYQTNPFNINPFRDMIDSLFDYNIINASIEKKIFLGTTNVMNGKIKVFSNIRKEINADTMMASACLPTLYQAVSINDGYFWDGGFIANPVIYPLIEHCQSSDIIVIQVRNMHTNKLPTSTFEISNRLKEITFNACLLREMRAIKFVTDLINKGKIVDPKMKMVHMHLIRAEAYFQDIDMSSALNTDEDFLRMLFERGRNCATEWLAKNFDSIGVRSSCVEEMEDFVNE